MVRSLPGETKVSWAENSHTVRTEGAEDSGTENATVAPQRGALLRAEGAAWRDSSWGKEADQEVPEE